MKIVTPVAVAITFPMSRSSTLPLKLNINDNMVTKFSGNPNNLILP